MTKTIIKTFTVSIALFLLATCNTYKFPQSPYPQIETFPVVNISKTGATFQANVTRLGAEEIISYGFIWGLDKNLYSKVNTIPVGTAPSLGNFEADAKSGFSEGKTYFVKAFVATADYFVYGETVSFTSQANTPPIIKSFSPLEGTWGDTVTIKGNNFDPFTKNNVVKFGSAESNVVASNDSIIKCIVPAYRVSNETLVIYVSVTGNQTQSADYFVLR